MNALTRLGLAPLFALSLILLALPGSAWADAGAMQTLAVADTIPPTDAAAPDSVQSEVTMPDSVQAAPASEPTAPPPPALAPAAGATTTTPPASTPSTTPPAAQSTAPAARKEPFSKGTTRVSLTAGWGRSFDEDYLMLGGGLGRFITNGLALGVDFEAWMLGDPGILKISPTVNYVLRTPRRTKPYVGGFWRRTMIEDAEDLSSIGGRAGAYIRGAGPAMLGGGVVYEEYLDCDDDLYQSCSQVYPEFLISVSF